MITDPNYLLLHIFILQNAYHCFCGNKYGRYGKATGQCKKRCTGNKRQNCGSNWRMVVYQLKKGKHINT